MQPEEKFRLLFGIKNSRQFATFTNGQTSVLDDNVKTKEEEKRLSTKILNIIVLNEADYEE